MFKELDWPEGKKFEFRDEPDEHDPCYVVMPDGALLPLAHHALNGVDQARAQFIVEACNEKLARLNCSNCGGLGHDQNPLNDPIVPAEEALAFALRNIIADANERVGWKEYAAHIRMGGADDLAARVAKDIAFNAYKLGHDDAVAAQPDPK